MNKCPHCGGTTGLFSKEAARYDQYYDFSGNECGYSDLDRVMHRGNTALYCINCYKRVTTLEKLEDEKCSVNTI